LDKIEKQVLGMKFLMQYRSIDSSERMRVLAQ